MIPPMSSPLVPVSVTLILTPDTDPISVAYAVFRSALLPQLRGMECHHPEETMLQSDFGCQWFNSFTAPQHNN